ncbi:MAG TPA: valine--tRNA ligase [Chitinophagales bacterium]|nr:valine--tRNA ligase [Chitinophagales bacterium]
MSEINKTYDSTIVENKWYQHWLERGYFKSIPDDRPAYAITIPPPNVTGILHMGHMLNNTIQDVLIRTARQKGFNACWVPGTDHASIATEAKVVGMLREKGIKKSDLSRDEFLAQAFEWKEKYGGIILEQLKQLGASCDWDRTSFTMDPNYYQAVIKVFVDLHKKGYLYRGFRMINWDVVAKTALSNEEVIYKEAGEQSQMYSVKYAIDGAEDEWVTIATTRPETIFADTAIAIHPEDERYQHLKGKMAIVPIINRKIPIIFDEYVEKDFGTGCLKVTPAHDPNDYDLGLKHELEIIDMFNDDGTANEKVGIDSYIGLDRFVVRKKFVKELEAEGFLVKTETITNKVGRSERTNSVVEPKLSFQWFLDMQQISKRALDVVENDEVALLPSKYKNTYRHWMVNVRDWCVSRQLWWGHRIPAWYLEDGRFVVAHDEQEALKKAQDEFGLADLTLSDLHQDEDVLDTWASSWLWPIEVFGGFDEAYDEQTGKIDFDKCPELRYYYPTEVIVTAPEILFFWIARMIIAGLEYTDEIPFKTVYLTGIVRDKQGRKMSKSLGNSPDPLDLIKEYGADGVRFGMLASAPAGNDILYDDKLVEQGRNFSNKLWNALRLLKGLEVKSGHDESLKTVFEWMDSRIAQVTIELERLVDEYRLSEAVRLLYGFIWDDFCSWYLEWIKPTYGEAITSDTLERTHQYFEQAMVLLHPYMPFITEEIWHSIHERKEGDDIFLQQYPVKGTVNINAIKAGDQLKSFITTIRNARAKALVSPKEAVKVYVSCKDTSVYQSFKETIMSKANVSELIFESPQDSKNMISDLVGVDKVYIDMGLTIDVEAEKLKLEEEIKYYKGFIISVEKKLSNERFVQNANPEVVEKERQKLADGIEKLKNLEEYLLAL